MTETQRRRLKSLVDLRRGLLDAISESMPAGYQDASADRNRFLTPVEAVVVDLDQEIAKIEVPT